MSDPKLIESIMAGGVGVPRSSKVGAAFAASTMDVTLCPGFSYFLFRQAFGLTNRTIHLFDTFAGFPEEAGSGTLVKGSRIASVGFLGVM